MPIALKPTDFTARVVWLGTQDVPVENLVITSVPVAADLCGLCARKPWRRDAPLLLARAGAASARHHDPQHPPTVPVSAEEMADVAAALDLAAEWNHAWVGASVVLEGIPDFTHLPPSSRLQGPDGVTLVVDMINHPCQEPAVTIAKATGGRGKAFKTVARDRRGVTAWVEREGRLRIGDEMRLHVPDQRPWAHMAAARALAAE